MLYFWNTIEIIGAASVAVRHSPGASAPLHVEDSGAIASSWSGFKGRLPVVIGLAEARIEEHRIRPKVESQVTCILMVN